MMPDYIFTGTVIPGTVSYEERVTFNGEDGLYRQIVLWLNSIWEEISFNPLVKIIEKQREDIDELYGMFDSIPEEFFSTDEITELRARLDNVENKLKTEIERNEKNEQVLAEGIAKLHTDIETLKETLTIAKKNKWYKTTAVKLGRWLQSADNRKLLKDGYGLVGDWLPENVKQQIPDINQ
jgi:hypothetical protein